MSEGSLNIGMIGASWTDNAQINWDDTWKKPFEIELMNPGLEALIENK